MGKTMGVGLPARDLAYFTGDQPGARGGSEIEQDLVGRYHEGLSTYGVTDYDAGNCWATTVLASSMAPLISGLGFAFAASTERGDRKMLTRFPPCCQAIRELGTLDRSHYPST